ncbi:hypothetical protein FANTH_12955 [Fusarium anthophilum]|uniref:Uncharacterized protein n=1 Tax=Fusarium anthophilum TaxID=48485 RepID=A0A8H4YQL3_9HYPO|nr:hypothetical protein FANTH_12955 [Fusarium anthophilum]
MNGQVNASGGDDPATRTSSGGFMGQTSNPEEISDLAGTIMRETGCTRVRFTLEPVLDHDSGASGARRGSRRGSSRAGVERLPRTEFVTVLSSGGAMGVFNDTT